MRGLWWDFGGTVRWCEKTARCLALKQARSRRKEAAKSCEWLWVSLSLWPVVLLGIRLVTVASPGWSRHQLPSLSLWYTSHNCPISSLYVLYGLYLPLWDSRKSIKCLNFDLVHHVGLCAATLVIHSLWHCTSGTFDVLPRVIRWFGDLVIWLTDIASSFGLPIFHKFFPVGFGFHTRFPYIILIASGLFVIRSKTRTPSWDLTFDHSP